MIRYFLTLCLSLPTALATFACAPAPSADKYQISEITLERSGSWGVRSGDKLLLRKDGTASYAGDVEAKRRGEVNIWVELNRHGSRNWQS